MELDFESSVEQLEAEPASAETPVSNLLENSGAQETLAYDGESAAVLVSALELQQSEPQENIQEQRKPFPASPLQQTLDEHLGWLESRGEAGHQADFSRCVVSGSELTDANLRQAILNKSVLSGADLLLTDFQGASLMQADLRGANLLGAKFQDANLQGANLESATGLQIENLSGANLFGAALPQDCSLPTALRSLNALSKFCAWFVCGLVVLCVLAALRIFTMSDAQLLANAPVAPLSGIRNSLRFIPFYLCAPVALLGIYIGFHVCLQRLWDAAARQPAIFPNGSQLHSRLPWFARWPVRSGMRWLREHLSSLASLEAAVSCLLLYGLVPLTLVLFWVRYLTMQEIRGTFLHVILISAAAFAGLYFAGASRRAYRIEPRVASSAEVWLRRSFVPGVALLFLLLSLGAIKGVPHDAQSQNQSASGISSWASDLLWWLGYSPTAQLAEAEVSTRPLARSGRTDDLAGVEGARLNGSHLRYMQAYAAFFAKARLWQSDLSHANLAEADLRESNLRQSVLQNADLDRARLDHAVLQEADLRHANFSQSDLQDANLSRVSASSAQFIDAKLDGANMYGADLSGAVLKRASLQHADLRDANLETADLSAAVLHQTYLSSAKMAGVHLDNAQLAGAFLTQADLRKADLHGAVLQGTMLNGTDLSGANLQGADFRGALGLTAAQICSASNKTGIQLDENLQKQAESLCNLNHQ